MKHKALLERVVALRPDILAAVVIADGKVVEEQGKESSSRPPEKDLARVLIQSQLMIGISSTNEGFAGKTNFVLISHEHLNALLVPLPDKKVLIVPFTRFHALKGSAEKSWNWCANNRQLT
jgi:hypothetical protein